MTCFFQKKYNNVFVLQMYKTYIQIFEKTCLKQNQRLRLRSIKQKKICVCKANNPTRLSFTGISPKQEANTCDPKKRRKNGKVIAGSVSGKKTKPGETGKDRNEGTRPELTHAERGEHQLQDGLLCSEKKVFLPFLYHLLFLWHHRNWCSKLQTFSFFVKSCWFLSDLCKLSQKNPRFHFWILWKHFSWCGFHVSPCCFWQQTVFSSEVYQVSQVEMNATILSEASFLPTGTGWSSWSASGNGTGRSGSSRKSSEILRSGKGGQRSGARKEKVDEMVSDTNRSLSPCCTFDAKVQLVCVQITHGWCFAHKSRRLNLPNFIKM